jgi:hypothetical protein
MILDPSSGEEKAGFLALELFRTRMRVPPILKTAMRIVGTIMSNCISVDIVKSPGLNR